MEERFWSLVEQTPTCWVWRGPRDEYGYGRFCIGHRKRRKAHRVAYELMVGPIPDGHGVLHHCDNPPCVRPDHLFTGTQSDNVHDAFVKGRMASGERHYSHIHPEIVRRGERHHGAKLTVADVIAIRLAATQGIPKVAIAEQYGINDVQVGRIVRRERWRHVA